MADYDLKYTGQQIDALLDAANELKTNGYIYKGVATPSTNPGTPTERVAYLASEPGTYTNFGGIVITSGLYSLTYVSGTWTGTQMSAGSDIEVVQTTGQSATAVMSQKAVTDEIMTPPQSWDLSYGGDFTWAIGTIHSDNGKAHTSTSYYHIYIPVSNLQGGRVKLQAQPTNIVDYAFLKKVGFLYTNNGADISAYYSSGYNNVITIPAGQEATFIIPSDCNYLYISVGQISGDVRVPQSNSYCTNKWGDVVQTTGDSTHAVMSQKAVTDKLEVLGDNLIDMSAMNADTTSTTYLSATKDVANNGVIFSVVRNNTKSLQQGRISRMKLITGKRYRLSFEYLNTAVDSLLSFRNSNGGYIPCSTIEDKPALYNTDYAEYVNDFIAPEGAYYLAFLNLVVADAGKSLTIRNFSCVEVLDIKDKIDDIDNNIEQLNDDINNIETDPFDIPVISDNNYLSALTGQLVSMTGGCHSNYLPTFGASKISVYAPPLGSLYSGIAFYGRSSAASFITPNEPTDYVFSHRGAWKWITYDVPEGATMFRVSLFQNTSTQYCLVTPINYLRDIFLRGVKDMIATQIFRNAKMVSETKYKCAFPVQQVVIINGKAYITYFGSETKYDDDAVGRPYSVLCRAVVNLGDMSHTTEYPTVGTTQYADGTTANPVKIGYVTECPTPNNSIAKFGLMRFNNKNPYYCWAIQSPDDTVNNWKTCILSYNGNTVDFTVNNYRQMLVDMGYTPTYIASTSDAFDNVNIHYDKTEGIYYAVLCQNNSAFPLVMMQSTDLATWSPKANLGASYSANEIEAIYKNGVAYVAWRTASSQMRWRIYDVTNSALLGEGIFPGTTEILSKPDVFTFNGNVYMAVNVNPSVYGMSGVKVYTTDARSQIAIYKVIGNTIKLFRQVCNPTGINYFSFMEINENYPAEVSQAPVIGQGSIYIAFSEDRRHFYRRQLAQISFADVTALFADNGRIG